MKKIVLFIVLLLLFVSCNKQVVSGKVMYKPHKFMYAAPDFYAEVYFTKLNIDTISLFLDAENLKEIIASGKQKRAVSRNQNEKDSLTALINEKSKDYLHIIKDSSEYMNLSTKALNQLNRIKQDNETFKSVVNEYGEYGLQMYSGDYHLVFVSEKLKNNNMLEARGKVIVKKIKVSDKPFHCDVEFQ